MTAVRGGPAGPNGVGGQYPNEVETDRTALFLSMGGRQGVLRGLVPSGVPGQMSLSFTPGAALVVERAADGTANNLRGYLVWSDTAVQVPFGPASVAARNDAVIACMVDVEDGPVGTGQLDVGPHIVAVPGVSGDITPRTDAQINAWVGRGGWVRLRDVPIAATDTQINMANLSKTRAFLLNDFNELEGVAAAPGWAIRGVPKYLKQGPLVTLQIALTRTATTALTAGSTGNIPDETVLTGLPSDLWPPEAKYMTFVRNGLTLGSARVTGSAIALTDMYPSATIPVDGFVTIQGTYGIAGE